VRHKHQAYSLANRRKRPLVKERFYSRRRVIWAGILSKLLRGGMFGACGPDKVRGANVSGEPITSSSLNRHCSALVMPHRLHIFLDLSHVTAPSHETRWQIVKNSLTNLDIHNQLSTICDAWSSFIHIPAFQSISFLSTPFSLDLATFYAVNSHTIWSRSRLLFKGPFHVWDKTRWRNHWQHLVWH